MHIPIQTNQPQVDRGKKDSQTRVFGD